MFLRAIDVNKDREIDVDSEAMHLCPAGSGSFGCRRVVGLDNSVLGKGSGTGSLRVNILLAGAINGDLNSNLAAFHLLAIHLTNSLLLQLLRSKRYEAKTAALAGFVASLELLHHVASDGAKGDLSSGWVVGREEFLEL